jgi:hypothetical protein
MINKWRELYGPVTEIKPFLAAVGRFVVLISKDLFSIKPNLSTMEHWITWRTSSKFYAIMPSGNYH